MSRAVDITLAVLVLALTAACTDTTAGPTAAPNPAPSLASGSIGGGGGGGGGGAVTPPATCAAQITTFDNVSGYGPYAPNVADITTRVEVKNCSGASVAWQARVTYTGPFWGGSTFDFPVSCTLVIAANSTGKCQVREKYIFIQQTYRVTLNVLDASGNVLATQWADVATPLVPNPATVI